MTICLRRILYTIGSVNSGFCSCLGLSTWDCVHKELFLLEIMSIWHSVHLRVCLLGFCLLWSLAT